MKLISIGLVILSFAICNNVIAQSSIRINGNNINQLDKKKRKQNEWIYFNDSGYVVMSCYYKDDVCISPMVFFKNSDTAFVKLPRKEDRQYFILYQNKEKTYGSFVYKKDSIYIEPDEETLLADSNFVAAINHYKNIIIYPVYYFAQKKLRDYTVASFRSADLFTNQALNVILTVSPAGLVTKVAFDNNKFMLSENQERELRWIYSTMPRWQPFFIGNDTKQIKVSLKNRFEVSISGGGYNQ